MSRLSAASPSPPPGLDVDGRWKNWLIDLQATHNLRDIRGNLLALAYLLAKEPAGTPSLIATREAAASSVRSLAPAMKKM